MRLAASKLAIAFLVLSSTYAMAWTHGVAAGGVSQAPLLVTVTVPFGNQTRTGHGSVRLSSPPVTTASIKPQSYLGLGLMSTTKPACDKWDSFTFVSNSAGRTGSDFTIIASNTAEGATAITPVPSSTGQGNLAGNYTWNVTCSNANGVSNTVAFVYQTYTASGAGAVMFGQGDRVDFGATPSGFGNVAGAEILFPVGADFHTTDLGQLRFAAAFTNQVTFKPADTNRKPYMTDLGIAGGMSNVRVTDFIFSGSMPGTSTAVVKAVGTNGNTLHDVIFDNIHYYGSEAMLGNTSPGAVGFGSCTSNCGISDSTFEYIDSGYGSANNSYVRNVSFRYVYNNCIFLTNASNFELSDVMCLSPMQKYPGGAHPDTMQVADGATPGPNFVMQRFLNSQADGDFFGQGPYFSGTYTGLTGFVDDGTGAHGPGNVFTPVPAGTRLGTASNGSRIIINGVIAATDAITLSCSTTSGCPGASSIYSLTGLAATNIGSSGSPVTMYGAGEQGFQISGIMSSQAGPYGLSTNGNAGTSWLYDYDYVVQDAQSPLTATFDGEIINGVLTAYNTLTGSRPPEIAAIASPGGSCCTMGRLAYVGCAYCGTVPLALLTGSYFGPGTYSTNGGAALNVARQTMTLTGAYPGTAVPAWSQQNCDKPGVFSGTNNVDRGFFQSGMTVAGSPVSCTVGVNFPATGTTIGSHTFGPTVGGYATGGGALTSADYASGMLPTAYLAAHTFTASDTPADILRINCLANKGKIGGKKDGGAGVWYGAVTGETNAVTHTGGGDWIIFNGTSHVASTHITGCELAP